MQGNLEFVELTTKNRKLYIAYLGTALEWGYGENVELVELLTSANSSVCPWGCGEIVELVEIALPRFPGLLWGCGEFVEDVGLFDAVDIVTHPGLLKRPQLGQANSKQA